MMKVDAVITWVDGADPAHRLKRAKWTDSQVHMSDDKAGDTRFANLNEIFWCVASLNRFAPWINRIYIVTDAQNPHIDEFLKTNFPEGYIPVEIVDHTVIFRGYEQYLPTFNSISLETMTWRIPGLSEHYIEFNDDLMLSAPLTPDEFFTEDGKVVCYGEWASLPLTRLTRLLKPRGRVTTKGSHANGAATAGRRLSYLRLAHCQKALTRSFYERYFEEHPDHLESNISHRFRSVEQFTSQELQYISLYDAGRCEVRSAEGLLFFYQPTSDKKYFRRKMEKLSGFKGKFLCFNSLDLADHDERMALEKWIESKLCIKLNNDYK